MKPITPVAGAGAGRETEWEYAELIERVEIAESRVDDLRAERERLRTELRIAQLWVKELALWLDEAQTRTGGKALRPASLALAPGTLALVRQREAEPIPWRRLATVGAIVTAPWALVAGLVWLVWMAL